MKGMIEIMIIIDNYLNERSVFEHSFDNLNETFNVMLNEGVGNVITNLKNLLKKFINFIKRKIIELKNAISSKFSKSKSNIKSSKPIRAPRVNLDSNFNNIQTEIKNFYLSFENNLKEINNNFLDCIEKNNDSDAFEIKEKFVVNNTVLGTNFDINKIKDEIDNLIDFVPIQLDYKEYKDDEIDKYYKFLENFKNFYKNVSKYGLDTIENLSKEISNVNNQLSKYINIKDTKEITETINSYLKYLNNYKNIIFSKQKSISGFINNRVSYFTKKIDKQKEN